MPHNVYRAHLVILGDPTVGKTALTQMFITDGREFPKSYNMTLAVDVHLKSVSIPGSDDCVKLLIYDSAGLDFYRDSLTKYWDGPSLLMIVYDVTTNSSFESLPQWLELALGSHWGTSNHCPSAQALVANKIDLLGRRVINEDKGRQFAEKNNLEYFETSSKENQGVEDVFTWLAKTWYYSARKHSNSDLQISTINRSNSFKTSTIVY